jgi:hypothetical protein
MKSADAILATRDLFLYIKKENEAMQFLAACCGR